MNEKKELTREEYTINKLGVENAQLKVRLANLEYDCLILKQKVEELSKGDDSNDTKDNENA